MPSPLKAAAKAVQGAVRAIGVPLAYRRTTTSEVRSAALYPAGVAVIDLKGCPDGWSCQQGDTFGVSLLVTCTVTAVAGQATGITFTPATMTAIAANQPLTFRRAGCFLGFGIVSVVDSLRAGSLVRAGDALVQMTAQQGFPPQAGDQVQATDGKWWTVLSVGRDPAAAAYTLHCR